MGTNREGRDEQNFHLRKGDRQHAADVQEAWLANQWPDEVFG